MRCLPRRIALLLLSCIIASGAAVQDTAIVLMEGAGIGGVAGAGRPRVALGGHTSFFRIITQSRALGACRGHSNDVMTNPKSAELPVRLFRDAAAWEAWLAEQHSSSAGLWLRIAKASSSVTSVSYAEALDVALCYGWIDVQKKAFDDATWLQKFTPRRKRSIWSKINREKVQRLIESGRMQAPGLEAVERAKANGQWDSAYDSHRTAGVPDDLQRALDAHPKAKAFFATLNSANRYAILFRIQTVTRAETRAKKIEQFVGMLERHEVIHR